MSGDQPDLFDVPCNGLRRPAPPAPASVLPFPLHARVGKVRDVARKLAATKSMRHNEHYRAQVTESLRAHLRNRRIPVDQHASELAAFWRAVEIEAKLLLHKGRP